MKRILFAFSILVLCSPVLAMKQNISICITAHNNSPTGFWAHFLSTDIFDRGKHIDLNEGKICENHTYNFGPKNLFLSVGAFGPYVRVALDPSCDFLVRTSEKSFKTNKYRALNKNEQWDFTFKQDQPNGWKYFTLSCAHSYSN